MYKIAVIAKRNSIHTVRWVNSLADRGCSVHLISCHGGGDELDDRIHYYQVGKYPPFCYWFAALGTKRLIQEIKPDIVHVHFASGYGTLGNIVGFHPYILSVWGSDVYQYPYRSFLHKFSISSNLKAADIICSTSKAMAEQTTQFHYSENLEVVPFGIDLNEFFPPISPRSTDDTITIGTVKSLEHIYGIDILIKSFAKTYMEFKTSEPSLANRLKLKIVGTGSKMKDYKKLVIRLNVVELVEFVGSVAHKDVTAELHKIDIFVAVSRSESFGVAVIEASATALPVIVSRVGGLPEVVLDGVTGYIVEPDNVSSTSQAMNCLIKSKALRDEMGFKGHEFVKSNYQWKDNVSKMESIYKKLINKKITVKSKSGIDA